MSACTSLYGKETSGRLGRSFLVRAIAYRLADINQGVIDVVVVYKIDRLTRPLTDFAKMVEVFDASCCPSLSSSAR